MVITEELCVGRCAHAAAAATAVDDAEDTTLAKPIK